MGPKTKAKTEKFLLGHPDSALREEFLQAHNLGQDEVDILPWSGPLQLPTIEQVLKLYFYLKEVKGKFNSHVSKSEVVNKVAKQVVRYWTMAGFDTVKMFDVVKNITKEVDKYEMLVKDKTKNSEGKVAKREQFKEDIKKLLDIASQSLEETLSKSKLLGKDDDCTRYRQDKGYTRKTEDLAFLIDQRGERKMIMGVRDESFEKRVVSNKERKEKEKAGVGVSSTSQDSKSGDHQPSDEIEEVDADYNGNSQDDDFELASGKQFKKKNTVLIELPKDILNSPDVCSMLDRTATTSRIAVGVISSVIKAGKIAGKDADLSHFTLSRSSLERKRVNNRSLVMEQVMEEFKEKKPEHAALHWDGKLIKNVTGVLQEHESILVSGAPYFVEGKLLSVTKLEDEDGNPTSTGEAQAQAVLEEIERWGLRDNVKALVFDTTASNSGVKKGATVRLMKELGRPVLFLACRHHVCELIAKSCWYALFEEDLGPENKFFSQIKNDWSSIEADSESDILTLDQDLDGRDEALKFCRELLKKKNKRNEAFIRDDYRELCELCMIMLGETPPSGKIVWRKPGACHKARFMAFGIYSLKALAFARQLNVDEETVECLKQFCAFLTTIYIPHFLASSVGVDAAVNDLNLHHKLSNLRSSHAQIADAALVVLRRHGWYLTPEVVIFSLFSDKISEDEKSRISCKLLTLRSSKPESYKLQKPKFPNIDNQTKLFDLITPESFKFFDILGLEFDWLATSPDKWEENESFKVAKNFVRTVKVVNDTAERGVKIAEDNATILTKDDAMRSMILQGVENNRSKYPDFKKITLNN